MPDDRLPRRVRGVILASFSGQITRLESLTNGQVAVNVNTSGDNRVHHISEQQAMRLYVGQDVDTYIVGVPRGTALRRLKRQALAAVEEIKHAAAHPEAHG